MKQLNTSLRTLTLALSLTGTRQSQPTVAQTAAVPLTTTATTPAVV